MNVIDNVRMCLSGDVGVSATEDAPGYPVGVYLSIDGDDDRDALATLTPEQAVTVATMLLNAAAEARARQERIARRSSSPDVPELLRDVERYLDQRQDIGREGGPNEAMDLLSRVQAVLLAR